MKKSEEHAAEFNQLVDGFIADSLSDSDLQRLEELLLESASAQIFFLKYCQLHMDLTVDERAASAMANFNDRKARVAPVVETTTPLQNPSPASLLFQTWSNLSFGNFAPIALLVAVLGTGVLLGALAVAAVPQWRGPTMPHADGVVALMTSFEGSRWTDADRFSPDRNSLVAGQQLELAAGSAQATFGFGATIVAQGPASFTPVSKKSVAVSEGKLTVDSPRAAHGFTVLAPQMEVVDVETPFGNRTKFALDVADRGTSVHVFEGEVCVYFHDGLRATSHAGVPLIRVPAGKGLTLDADTATVKQIASDPTVFMPSPSERESDLVISEKYVSAVKAAKPVAYWRFEQAASNAIINNEMPTPLPLRICGDARIESSLGNGRAVFPQTGHESWLKTEDVVKAFAGDYALETWMKADSYHEGDLLSLTQKRLDGESFKAVAHLELIPAEHLTCLPGCIRYLHREPAGLTGGTNVLSNVRYVPKQWHHIVATKLSAQISLYIDGNQVGAEHDPKRLTIDPQIVIGRLHADSDFQPTRPFVGQIDEVAVYDRALKAEEVAKHFILGSARDKSE